MVRNFKHQMDRLMNKGVSGSSTAAYHGKIRVLDGIKFGVVTKSKDKAFDCISLFPMLWSKKNFNESLLPRTTHLCQNHVFGANLRKMQCLERS